MCIGPFASKEYQDAIKEFLETNSAIHQIEEILEKKEPAPGWIISEIYLTFFHGYEMAKQKYKNGK